MSTSVFLRHSSPAPLPQSYQGGLVIDLFAEPQRSTLATNFDAFLATVGQPSPLGLDFLFLSSGLYVADKKTPRRLAPDRWTRTFEVSASATDPTLWMAATPHLREAVSFLTGDQWTFQWRAEPYHQWPVSPRTHPQRVPFDAVCLFSGGLDSLVGAINLLETNTHQRLLLLGHNDSYFLAFR